jgi:hypothetical protein
VARPPARRSFGFAGDRSFGQRQAIGHDGWNAAVKSTVRLVIGGTSRARTGTLS